MLQKGYNIINKKPPDQWYTQLARELVKMTRTEAARRLRELAHEIYYTLEDMKDILREVDPEELEMAEVYWMAHIDEALLNIKGWTRRSLTNLEDVITSLEKEDEEEDD